MRLISYDNHGRAAIGVIKSADATEFVDLGATGLAFSTDMTDLLAAPGGLRRSRPPPTRPHRMPSSRWPEFVTCRWCRARRKSFA